MQQILDCGQTVAFGQDLKEIEKLFSRAAIDDPLPISRIGIDKIIRTENVNLVFDSGKLKIMEFAKNYKYINPPAPYSQTWKNLDTFSENKIGCRMHRSKLLLYLSAWEERALAHAVHKVDFGELNRHQYAISIEQEEYHDMIHISMGPTRRASRQGLWCDGWTILFGVGFGNSARSSEVGLLESISAFCDDFNTMARKGASPA